VQLTINGGLAADNALRAIRARYPRYRVVNGCVGSFKAEGTPDIAIALVNPSTKIGVYAVILDEPGAGSIHELATFPVAFNEQGNRPKELETRCESRTALMRIVQEYSAPRLETPTASASIKPLGDLDAVCVAPFALPEDFVCYAYNDGANKRFVKIGSWFND
jgi:hypothetical protein